MQFPHFAWMRYVIPQLLEPWLVKSSWNDKYGSEGNHGKVVREVLKHKGVEEVVHCEIDKSRWKSIQIKLKVGWF